MRPDLAGPALDQAAIAAAELREDEVEGLIRQAITRAPDWAAPHAALARLSYFRHELALGRGSRDETALALASSAAARAIALEPSSAAAGASRGLESLDSDPRQAFIDARDARALDPHESAAHRLEVHAFSRLELLDKGENW